jgi:hypothetical protein
MALTIYTVGAKNACYEALANLGVLAKLASDTKSGWDFHVTAMIDHVKSAMSQLDSSPAQAGTHLERAINTLGMLRKIDPVRLNDIQKGSLKQLIGYVAKSLRDARANIKVVTTASRPGVKAKFEDGGTRGAQALAFIKSKIAAGRTVAITTATRSTQITPKTYAKWETSGTPLFKLTSGGDLQMYEGGSYVFVTQGTTPLAKISSFARPSAKAKMAAEIASDPRDKDFEKLKTLKGVVHQGKGFYIIPGKLMTPERRTKVKRSTQRYELSNMGDLVGWGTNHPNVNDYRLKDWAEAFA